MNRDMDYRVLFVDDEPWGVIDAMESVPWSDAGFSVIGHSEKPVEAFGLIMKQSPDLVFTDIRMPVWDGFELIKRCREAGSDTEFIILSGHADFILAQQAIRSAVLDYCLKPINPEIILKLLDGLRPKLQNKRAVKGLPFTEGTNKAEGSAHFDKILNYVRENYGDKLELTGLAERFNFNKNYICHLFKRYAGITFTSYLTGIRIDAAKKLLISSGLSQGEIAAKTGFSDYYYFNKVFKAECGLTPFQYQKENSAGKS